MDVSNKRKAYSGTEQYTTYENKMLIFFKVSVTMGRDGINKNEKKLKTNSFS